CSCGYFSCLAFLIASHKLSYYIVESYRAAHDKVAGFFLVYKEIHQAKTRVATVKKCQAVFIKMLYAFTKDGFLRFYDWKDISPYSNIIKHIMYLHDSGHGDLCFMIAL